MEYRSRQTLLGLPLVHVAVGSAEVVSGVYHRKVAKGWIAIGDISFGVILSLGGLALGGICLGGLACGVLAIGGLAVGLICLGGLAVGGYAIGGLAIGILAIGGGAMGLYAAFGGGLLAQHANDAVAKHFMDTSIIRYGKALIELNWNSPWMNLVWLLSSFPSARP